MKQHCPRIETGDVRYRYCTQVVALSFMLLLPVIAVYGESANSNDSRGYESLAPIDAIAQRALEETPLAGLSIAVAKGSEIIHAKGYGYADLEHQIPATPETVYRIGSVTKQFTAAAILKLVEAEKLHLNDDLREYVPDFPTADRIVTIRQLLNHTSGIRSVDKIQVAMANRCLDVTREQLIGWISSEPFDFAPGEDWMYNNSGYWLLGLVIENLTKDSYGESLRKELFEPIGLERTSYDSYERIIANRARGYAFEEGEFVHHEYNSPTRTYAAGALLSTVLDLVKWQHALFLAKVVGSDHLRLMTTPGQLSNGKTFPYGFGFQIAEFQGHRRISHAGQQMGYRAFLSHYPDEGISIAVLINTDGHSANVRIEEEIAEVLFSLKSG